MSDASAPLPRIPLAGVIGSPIAHSRSPRLHGHWLRRYGLPGHYVPLDVPADKLLDVVRLMPSMGFVGANVTVPYKEKVMEVVDQVTDRATLIGAVNTLIFRSDGRIHGDNTDGYGFLANIRQEVPDWSAADGPAVVLGAGGAARAVIEANGAFLDLVRTVSLDRVEGKPLDLWLGASSVDLQVLMANLREHGSVRRFSTVVRDEVGATVAVEVSATAVAGPDGRTYGFSIREGARSEPTTPRIEADPTGTAAQFTDLVGRVPLKDLVRDTADIIEKLCIEAALRLTDNNRASAADMLGLSRQSLYMKLKRYGIAEPAEEERE